MSLHTQLLRGLLAFPVLVLLAVASLSAPARPVRSSAPVDHAHAIVVIADGRVAIVAGAGEAR